MLFNFRHFVMFGIFFFPLTFIAQLEKKLDSLCNLSDATIQSNAYKLIKPLQTIQQQAIREKNNAVLAKVHSTLSLTYYYAGDFPRNKFHSLQAISLYEKSGNYAALAHEYGELGFRMKDIDLQNAAHYMQKGIFIAESKSLDEAKKSLYNNYGTILIKKGLIDSALYYFNQSVLYNEKFNDQLGLTYSYNNIGALYLEKQQYELAKSYFTKALNIRLKHNNKYGIADSYAYLGDLAYAQNEYVIAQKYFLQSLEIAEKNKISNLIKYAYGMLKKSFESAGDFKSALTYSNKLQQFNDSLLTEKTQAKIVEYQTRFETAEKEKELVKHRLEAKIRTNTIWTLSLIVVFLILLAWLIFRALRLKNKHQKQAFELKEQIAAVETENSLQGQRLAISRDLHDNIGSQLTFIISSIDNLKFAYQIPDERINQKMDSIADFARSTITELRDTIWAMNHSNIRFDDIQVRIATYLEKAKNTQENIQFSFNVQDGIPDRTFSSMEGMNCYRIIQEAINNSLKYANASAIDVNISQENSHLVIQISDNGKGFDEKEVEIGNGLRNMQNRAIEMGGTCEIKSEKGLGTTIFLHL